LLSDLTTSGWYFLTSIVIFRPLPLPEAVLPGRPASSAGQQYHNHVPETVRVQDIPAISMVSFLLLFAHPALEKSRVNRLLLDAVQSLDFVTVNDLYEQYPTFDIDIDREQALLLQHEYIILQHPFYWYSAPPLVKQWLDLVLEHGWAYGQHGTALAGKKMLSVITSGGPAGGLHRNGTQPVRRAAVLLPFEQTARLCNMAYLPPFVVHGTLHLTEPEVQYSVQQYRTALSLLAGDPVDWQSARPLEYLNELLP
jgi:glutathione-regulated potassium-efflux system ancillary protein KefG